MKAKQILTLVWVTKTDQILLGLKKRGHGLGLWNGFGGKVESGETIMAGAVRELYEECQLVVDQGDLKFMAIITYDFDDKPYLMEVHFFRTDRYVGDPQESDEMIPKWYPMSDMPFDQMWTDVRLWFPLFRNRCRFVGHFKVTNKCHINRFLLNEITDPSVDIQPIDSLPL